MNDENMIEKYENMIQQAQLQASQSQLQNQQNEIINEEREKGMLQEQLDVGEILDRIHHLLKGYTLQRNSKTGQLNWVEPHDPDMIILTDFGINYIMNSVQWYLNKNTLLSNYDEDTILKKMEDFAITIIDNVFMEYDKMFSYPTLEDCKKELDRRLQHKLDIRKYTLKMTNIDVNEEEIKASLLAEIEDRIERELEVIKQQKIKNKLKRFESLMRFVQDTVHSVYLRAWKGQERTTLRQHITVSETKGGLTPMPSQGQGSLNIFRRNR